MVNDIFETKKKFHYFFSTSSERTLPPGNHSGFFNSLEPHWGFSNTSPSHGLSPQPSELFLSRLLPPQYPCAPQVKTTAFGARKQGQTRPLAAKTVFNKDPLPIRTALWAALLKDWWAIFSLIQVHWHMTRCAQLAGRKDNTYEHSGFGLWTIRDGWKAKILTLVGIVKVMLK